MQRYGCTHLQLRVAEGRAGGGDAVGRQQRRGQVLAARPGCLGGRRRGGDQRHLSSEHAAHLEHSLAYSMGRSTNLQGP
jgi:hypothetical protein